MTPSFAPAPTTVDPTLATLLPIELRRRYVPLRLVGRGGMGAVIAVYDRLLGRNVALKLVPGHRAEEFSRLQSLELPGVVTVHDAGFTGEGALSPQAFFTMDYLEGLRLDRWLDGRPAEAEVALVVRRLLQTLARLEDEGVVHGDVKPQNIVLVGSEGPGAPFPVLIDFGLARDADDDRVLDGGTRRYLAPELIGLGSRRPTPASDRFAAGRSFEAWARRDGEGHGPAAAMRERVLALLADDPDLRPRGLGERTARFQSVSAARALLGRELSDSVRATLAQGPVVRVAAPGLEDASLIARVLTGALRDPGDEVWLVPTSSSGDPALAVMHRLMTALGSDPSVLAVAPSPEAASDAWPDARREQLEAVAARVVIALRRLGGLPTLVIPLPERLAAADRHVLLRCMDARVFPAVVLVTPLGASAIWSGTVGVSEATAPTVVLAAPDASHVEAWLGALGVDPMAPPIVAAALVARAVAGPWALGAMLGALVEAGALVAAPSGSPRFRWANAEDALAVDSPELSVLWDRLLGALDASERRAIEHLRWLGGVATQAELGGAAESALLLVDRTLARLTVDGEVELVPGLMQRWRPEPDALTGADAQFLCECLERRPVGAARLEALGHLRQRGGALDRGALDRGALDRGALDRGALDRGALDGGALDGGALVRGAVDNGALDRAAQAFADAARLAVSRFDPAEAARLWLLAAKAAIGPGLTDIGPEALDFAEASVRSAEVSGQAALLDDGLGVVERAAQSIGTPFAARRHQLLQARIALFRGDAGGVLERLAADGDGPPVPAHDMEADLLRGTAEGTLGNIDVGVAALARAAGVARQLGDSHVLGKIANNLGNMELERGHFAAAEASYAEAVLAKRATGDRRGERIAETNRALAERAEGRLSAAIDRATAARDVSVELGDRRGEAVTTMVLALLWLDLGEPTRAAPELERLSALPVLSAVADADATITRARWELACSPLEHPRAMSDACDRLSTVHQTATARGLAAARREAAWLLVAAGPERVPTVVSEALIAEPTDGLGAADRVALGAARAWLYGLAGELSAARDELEAVLQLLPPRLWAGSERALGLLDHVATLVGSTIRTQLRDVAIATARSRLLDRERAGLDTSESALSEAFQGIGLPWSEQLARYLLKERSMPPRDMSPRASVTTPAPRPPGGAIPASDVPVEATPAAAPAPQRRPTPSLAERLASLSVDHRLQTLAQAVRADSGAARIWLWDMAGGAPTQLTTAPAEAISDALQAQAAAIARRAPTAGAFTGRDHEGRIESMAMRLGGSAAIGLRFAPATDHAPEAILEALKASLAVGALVIDAYIASARESATRAALEETTASHAKVLAEKLEEVTSLRDELDASRTESAPRAQYERIVHQSPAMRRVLRLVDKVAPADVSVLVLGESGVGKELLARAIHAVSLRCTGPFLAENTGAIPHDLFESVFFGHVRGAFTGAVTAQRGLVEAAAGGTLFLDEVGELRLDHQAKLLRVLQERRYRPVGSPKELVADFRLVCATNRDLRAMIQDGTFREDLYYRIAVMTIAIPPLRERKEDLVPIAERLLEAHSRRSGRVARLSPAAADRLATWSWPGNVRELENELMRAAILSDGVVEPRHLSPDVRAGARPSGVAGGRIATGWDGITPLDAIVSGVEREVIASAMDRLGHKKSAVAAALGLSRPGLDAKLARFGIVGRKKTRTEQER